MPHNLDQEKHATHQYLFKAYDHEDHHYQFSTHLQDAQSGKTSVKTNYELCTVVKRANYINFNDRT